jgi:hypothetical protein
MLAQVLMLPSPGRRGEGALRVVESNGRASDARHDDADLIPFEQLGRALGGLSPTVHRSDYQGRDLVVDVEEIGLRLAPPDDGPAHSAACGRRASRMARISAEVFPGPLRFTLAASASGRSRSDPGGMGFMRASLVVISALNASR